ncbi:hypothetical protein GGQ97_001560 [Sphingomonas kaistensis]|uniref:Uncharacterized protein n=1 Tax=Sphingomonas kaistensis TaxID=298708 RepID=A0A7X6BH62_9SPHN|nr:hypothetical protein [Sphingomonas kaistensis]NJC05767.1 hypothetical protein [Sphingomonas kaistensis]
MVTVHDSKKQSQTTVSQPSDEPPDSLLIFTEDPARDLLDANNSAAWRLNLSRASKAKYIILARKDKNKGEGHRAAFLIAKIKDIVARRDETTGETGKWAILFDQAAAIDIPNAFKPSQQPIRYLSARKLLGFDPEECDFKPVPKKKIDWSYSRRVENEPRSGARKLTVAEAKEGLAAQFGCSPSAIEISIKV